MYYVCVYIVSELTITGDDDVECWLTLVIVSYSGIWSSWFMVRESSLYIVFECERLAVVAWCRDTFSKIY